MNKAFLILLIIATVLTLTACSDGGQKNSVPVDTTTTSPTQNNSTTATGGSMTGTTTTPESWGVADRFVASTDEKNVGYTIHFPALTGIPEVTGLVAYQNDGTLIVLDGQVRRVSEPVDGIENVFPTYFNQTTKILRSYKTSSNSDYAFEVKGKELVKVNDYDMCKYTGVLTYKTKEGPVSSQFVAYATKLKENGAYVYWMVLDESENQSLGELIASHAINMAKTLREHE